MVSFTDYKFSRDMASHVLNPSYRHASLSPIGYTTLRVKNDSLSSESSGHPNSPEYSQKSISGKQNSGSTSDWYISNQSIASQSHKDTSLENDYSDDEYNMKESEGNNSIDMGARENIEVCQINVEDEIDEEMEIHHTDITDNMDLNTSNDTDDHSLVEGLDYEVIAVYTVNPHAALLDSSSEDDGEEYITDKNTSINVGNFTSYTWQDGKDTDFKVPIISNVDECFVKNDNKDQHIFNVDEPVVQNADEYFLDLDNNAAVPNVDDYFIKHKLPEERARQFELPDSTNKIDFIFTDNNKPSQENDPQSLRLDTVTDIVDISIDESDLKALPKIDDIKKYLIDDMTYTKFRPNQETCSVPPSPMPNICMDVDDTKNCIGFDYLTNNSNGIEKVSKQGKSEDVFKTLTDDDVNSFICKYSNTDDTIVKHKEDDSSPQDMEIETTISSGPPLLDTPSSIMTTTPMPTVLNYCIEETSEKVVTPVKESKIDLDDFIDVESYNDAAIPVLEANNLNSLLEQIETTEKLNTKKCPEPIVNFEDSKVKSCNKNIFTNGMRLQDAAMQLNKNKMRQILMPTPVNSTIRRSESPVHSDHDNCSPKKKQSLPNLKKGQSLLKLEVLSSNNTILNTRNRSCKSKKVVYYLSSDEESEDKNFKHKKVCKFNDIDLIKKNSANPSVKPPVQSNSRIKLSPTHSDHVKSKNETNNSVMLNSAYKDSDNCSENSSIKLTIKTKSEDILNYDNIHSQKDKTVEMICKNSDNINTNNIEKIDKCLKELGNNKFTVVSSPRIEEGPNSKIKKKLNLQEYKLRRGVSSNTSSAKVSPEVIFPDLPSPGLDKAVKCHVNGTSPNGLMSTAENVNTEEKFFDPIKEAGRKIIMNLKKQKDKAIRKRDEDMVMSKIPKVENFQLQPLISDEAMMKLVGMTKPEVLKPPVAKEKPRLPINYEEITLVSVGVNTHKDMFQKSAILNRKTKTTSPPVDSKSMINSNNVLKQNVFDIMKRESRIPIEQKKQDNLKINKERFKDITTALKSVKKQVDSKMSSNSLFASIQDVVIKKAPEDIDETYDERHLKSKSNIIDNCNIKWPKNTIVREYDSKAGHGEDKVILHLAKDRNKPKTNNILVQTDPMPEFTTLTSQSLSPEIPLNRKRNYGDMSLSSAESLSCKKKVEEHAIILEKKVIQPKEIRSDKIKRERKEKRSRSKDRYEFKYRCRSRSTSRSCRRRSRSRSQSRSHGRYRRYQRSDSPYKRKRRSRSRSYHKRRSPSVRRDRPKKSDYKSHRPARPEARSKTPEKRFKPNASYTKPKSNTAEKKNL